jgi:SAM-dependent methyltransferase
VRALPPIYANLGCGPRSGARAPEFFAGWRELRVDVEAAVDPDIVADISDLGAIASQSLDGVWCSHCLEHLYEHQVDRALSEMARILRPDGHACILVPDLQTVAGYIAADKMHETLYGSPAGPITPHDVVFGFGRDVAEGLTFMAHRCGFTPSAMIRHLQSAAFGEFVLVRRANFELAVIARKSPWPTAAERDALVERLRL